MGLTFGAPMLLGDNTIPGACVPKEIKEAIPHIFRECSDFGLDYYPTVVEFLTFDDMSEVAAYSGFPVRYPHWSFGMEYEELSKGFEHGMQRIFEMVVNTNPCYLYCLDSNTYTDNVTVIAHALGHNDFFKNNLWFKPTGQKFSNMFSHNMMNEFANHRSRVIQYMQRWGKEEVTAFIDYCKSMETLIDPAKAWSTRKATKQVHWDERTYHFARRLKVPEGKDYLQNWINTPEYMEYEAKRIADKEVRENMDMFEEPTKDIMGYMRDHAPLKAWQQDILAMLYEEAMYFQPQRMTKMLNEGWASYVDYNIMARRGMPNCGIFEYADHKARVLGGKYSMNPYKIGFELFLYIEDRWNKGRFGVEWDNCTNHEIRSNWDRKLGLGHEKVFEVRANYDDVTAIAEFLDQDFVDKHEFFWWKKYPSREPGVAFEYKIESRDAKVIKRMLMQRYLNGGLPIVRLADPNFRNKGIMLWEHRYDGRTLLPKFTHETLVYSARIWQKPVVLLTRNKNGEEIALIADGSENVRTVPAEEAMKL